MSQSTETNHENQAPSSQDALTELLRTGAQRLIAHAIEAEVEQLLAEHKDITTITEHRAVVRNGFLPERQILTGIGTVNVQVPKVRGRSGNGVKFTSRLLPPYLRRAESIHELLPLLYLKRISAGDMQEALTAMVGEDARGLSSSVVSRLKATWFDEYQNWNNRELTVKHYLYLWADGIHFNVRSDTDRQCILVIMGATENGEKEFVAIEDGYRESEQSWMEVLLDLRHRGLNVAPALAIGDGALGFWKALEKVFPTTRHHRCWVHKTANVLGKLPKHMHGKAKAQLQNIWMAETREHAEKAFDSFLTMHDVKYPKASDCLRKDREKLLAFYDFPAEHWQHIRTTNPIESTFATVRLSTAKTRNCVSRTTILTMVFKLGQSAQKRWHRLRGANLLEEVKRGVRYGDGVRDDGQLSKNGQSNDDRIAT